MGQMVNGEIDVRRRDDDLPDKDMKVYPGMASTDLNSFIEWPIQM
jgi:hypothetical protein